MNWLAEWVLGSSLVQGLVTLALVGTTMALALAGRPTPEELKDALMLVLGFWFGSKSAHEAQRLVRKMKTKSEGGE
jgi:hypothetical protein